MNPYLGASKVAFSFLSTAQCTVSTTHSCASPGYLQPDITTPKRCALFNATRIQLAIQESVLLECGSLRWGQFKPLLTEAIIEHLRPIQIKYKCAGADFFAVHFPISSTIFLQSTIFVMAVP
jgi:hypothetical protein